MFEDKSIYLCSFCGEKLQGKRICASCKTKEQRKAKLELQLEIDSENSRRKDRKITERIFFVKRDILMAFYGVK